MNPALRVLAPGLLTTVQDLGRPGYQSMGIPVSGALDPLSLRAANALVGNPPGAGALEVASIIFQNGRSQPSSTALTRSAPARTAWPCRSSGAAWLMRADST
jgi:allophanate hydrolase subunit 2